MIVFNATLAQLVERLICNEDVVSSTLTSGSLYARVAQMDRASAF